MLSSTVLLSLLLAPLSLAAPAPVQPQGLDLVAVNEQLSKRDELVRREDSVRNELFDQPCQRVTFIFARGTSEERNVGDVAGPPTFNALEGYIGAGNVAVQGVDYPANLAGYFAGGDEGGANRFAYLVQEAYRRCPNTQVVIGGYSQGAQVVRKGAARLPTSVTGKITAAVLFGDPGENQGLQGIANSKIRTYCFDTDFICDGQPVVSPIHLSYGVKGDDAARFVVSKLS